jgi:virginiamycin B lyase
MRMARTVAVGVGLVLALMLAGRVISAELRPSVPPSPSVAATTASTLPTSAATPPTAVVATIAVGGAASQVTVAAGAVWVGGWDTGMLVRVDPATNRIAARIRVGRPQESPIAVAATAEAVWVVDFGDAQVLRVDPATNRVVARIPVRGGAGGIATGAGAVWVTSGEGGDQHHGWFQRIDPSRNRVVATTAVPSGMLWDIDVDGPSVWVGSELGGLFRIDAHTSRVTTIRKPGGAPEGGAGGVGHLAAGAGAVWVASDGQLQRRDARSGRVVATIPWADGSFAARVPWVPVECGSRPGRAWHALTSPPTAWSQPFPQRPPLGPRRSPTLSGSLPTRARSGCSPTRRCCGSTPPVCRVEPPCRRRRRRMPAIEASSGWSQGRTT